MLLWSVVCTATITADSPPQGQQPGASQPQTKPQPAAEPDKAAQPKTVPVYAQIAGNEAVHVVAAGETLGQIARHYGARVSLAAAMNGVADPAKLRVGQRLLMSNRRIIPANWRNGLVVDLAILNLYWFRDGELTAVFPVAAGREDWETPAGQYTITSRRRDPVWTVPPSIQREMRAQGQPIKKKVLPGPDNPLGKYWLQLSGGSIGIHGTNAPWSVGKYATHGCIRLREEHVERLFNEVANGTHVAIVADPVRIARLADGRVMLEAHGSVKKKISAATLERELHAAGLADDVDLGSAERALQDGWGVAVDITRKKPVEEQARR
jgi:L,D-transpeptidase ErfK/SrfK